MAEPPRYVGQFLHTPDPIAPPARIARPAPAPDNEYNRRAQEIVRQSQEPAPPRTFRGAPAEGSRAPEAGRFNGATKARG